MLLFLNIWRERGGDRAEIQNLPLYIVPLSKGFFGRFYFWRGDYVTASATDSSMMDSDIYTQHI